jgi:hypothetical protein
MGYIFGLSGIFWFFGRGKKVNHLFAVGRMVGWLVAWLVGAGVLLFLDFLNLEDGTDTLSQNVGKGLPLDAA